MPSVTLSKVLFCAFSSTLSLVSPSATPTGGKVEVKQKEGGKYLSVTWNAVSNAASYTVTVRSKTGDKELVSLLSLAVAYAPSLYGDALGVGVAVPSYPLGVFSRASYTVTVRSKTGDKELVSLNVGSAACELTEFEDKDSSLSLSKVKPLGSSSCLAPLHAATAATIVKTAHIINIIAVILFLHHRARRRAQRQSDSQGAESLFIGHSRAGRIYYICSLSEWRYCCPFYRRTRISCCP